MMNAIKDTLTPNNTKIPGYDPGVIDRKFRRLLESSESQAQDEVEKASDSNKLDSLAGDLPESGNAEEKVRKAFKMVRDGHELLGYKKGLMKAFEASLTPAGSIRDDHDMPDFLKEEKLKAICVQIKDDQGFDVKELCRQHLGSFRGGKANGVDVKVFEKVYGEVSEDAINGDIDLADVRKRAVSMRDVYKFELYRTIELASNGCNGLEGIRTRVNRMAKSRNSATANEETKDKDPLGPAERFSRSLARTAKRIAGGHGTYGVAESNIVDSNAPVAQDGGKAPVPVTSGTVTKAASANAEKLAKSAEEAKKKS
jgi:hypothetical protein